MVQLRDDCFAVSAGADGLIPLDQALALIAARLTPVMGEEMRPLDQACGGFAAVDHRALVPVPGHDNSAVDGFAFCHADLAAMPPSPDDPAFCRFQRKGRVVAGPVQGLELGFGEAAQIFTGAALPAAHDLAGAPRIIDSIAMLEDCQFGDDWVDIPYALPAGANRRFAGEDKEEGAVIVAQGTRLTARHIALLAATGHGRACLYQPLRVGLLSTGDELVEPAVPSECPAKGQIYDSNRIMLKALLQGLGYVVVDAGIIPDRAAALDQAIWALAARCDVMIASGGMSLGEEDHMRDFLSSHGQLAFWRVAIKPGRPVGLGLLPLAGRTVPVIGLPGNPVAALTTYALIAQPLLARLAGNFQYQPPLRQAMVAGFSYRKKAGRREYVRVALQQGPDGPRLAKYGRSGAAILSSVVGAAGLVELGEAITHIEPGDMVDFIPFDLLLGQGLW